MHSRPALQPAIAHASRAELFYFETWPPPSRLRNRHDDHCLDWHTGNNNLYWGGCHDGANQKVRRVFALHVHTSRTLSHASLPPPPSPFHHLHARSCFTLYLDRLSQFMFENPAQTAEGWVAYGNAYQDLKDQYCGGGTCGTDQWWALRTHCYDYGVDEARPIPRTSGSSCKGNFVVPKAEDVNSAARIQSPWEGRNECFDEGPGSTLYMHTCHDGDNRARRTVLFAHPYTLPSRSSTDTPTLAS